MFRRDKAAFLVGLILSVSLLAFPAIAPLPPVADFTYTPEAPILGDVVFFDASASDDPDGSIVSYRWNFGDGKIITVPDPVAHHNYTAIGTYNVTLTVTDNSSLTDTVWKLLTVRNYPVAKFTYSPAVPIVGQTVTFNASLSTPDGGTIVSYRWDFGDENVTTVSGPVITHVYKAPKSYTVTLNVTDSEGLWDTESKSIGVIGFPEAKFTYSPAVPIVGQTVTFNASLSTADGGYIVSYFWDFGDGTNGNGTIVTHVYTATGSRTVILNIRDSEGLTDTAQATFTVRDYPVAFFKYKPALPLVNEMVTFNASLSTPDGGTIVSYRWNFGDGNITTKASPVITHAYKAFGTYNVSLTITDSEDLSDTLSDTIRILIVPVANFAHSPAQPIVNKTITFNASASDDPDGSIVSYRWNFGDGNITVAGAVITHAYKAEETYNVTLTVTDNDGLTDTVWKLVTVYTFLYTHDVAITSVTASANEVYPGWTVNITVVARNEGDSVETFTVTVYYGNTKVETKTVEYALPGSQKTLVFSWNTAGLTPCHNYIIKANATIIGFVDINPANNELVYGQVKVRIVGDANGDDRVSVADMVQVDIALGSRPGELGPPYWNPYADVNEDGRVSVADMVQIDIHLGEAG